MLTHVHTTAHSHTSHWNHVAQCMPAVCTHAASRTPNTHTHHGDKVAQGHQPVGAGGLLPLQRRRPRSPRDDVAAGQGHVVGWEVGAAVERWEAGDGYCVVGERQRQMSPPVCSMVHIPVCAPLTPAGPPRTRRCSVACAAAGPSCAGATVTGNGQAHDGSRLEQIRNMEGFVALRSSRPLKRVAPLTGTNPCVAGSYPAPTHGHIHVPAGNPALRLAPFLAPACTMHTMHHVPLYTSTALCLARLICTRTRPRPPTS